MSVSFSQKESETSEVDRDDAALEPQLDMITRALLEHAEPARTSTRF